MTSLFGKKPARLEWNTEKAERELERSPEALEAQRALTKTLRQELASLQAELGNILQNIEKGTAVEGTGKRIRELRKRIIEKKKELRVAQERLQRNETA